VCSNATDQSNADLCKARSIPFLGSTSTKQRGNVCFSRKQQ